MRTIAIIFVSTSLDRGARAPRVPFAAPSPQTGGNGAHPTTRHPKPFGEAPNGAREARALPNYLFWTWFIDNPRPRSAPLQ
jgi:hypothetical protein